jgi:hypothetical protein
MLPQLVGGCSWAERQPQSLMVGKYLAMGYPHPANLAQCFASRKICLDDNLVTSQIVLPSQGKAEHLIDS